MIDKNLIQMKIDLIEQGLQHLLELKDMTFDEIAKDFFKYSTLKLVFMEIIGRAISVNEHLISEISITKEIKTPLTYRDTFLLLGDLKILPEDFAKKIAKSAGFRNAIVHDYNKLDRYIIFSKIGEAIKQYIEYCTYISKFIQSTVT